MNEKIEVLISKKDVEDLSGFARILRNKMIEYNTTWNITIDAVEYLDSLTQSSPGLSFALLSKINPTENSIVTLEMVKERIHDEVDSFSKERLSSYYSLYNQLIREKRLYSVFQR